ncbi:unnamed protein product [Rhizophagus irregularis]|nr:unnamed protein product [Rhizophagus irregularis]
MTNKNKKVKKSKKSKKCHHSDSDSDRNLISRVVPNKGCEIIKGKKPIFIDLVDEYDEGNDDMIQQNERNNDQSTQQNERNNDSNESALQMQVEELTRLLKTVTKGKQKVTDPKENIIDWSNVDLET